MVDEYIFLILPSYSSTQSNNPMSSAYIRCYGTVVSTYHMAAIVGYIVP